MHFRAPPPNSQDRLWLRWWMDEEQEWWANAILTLGRENQFRGYDPMPFVTLLRLILYTLPMWTFYYYQVDLDHCPFIILLWSKILETFPGKSTLSLITNILIQTNSPIKWRDLDPLQGNWLGSYWSLLVDRWIFIQQLQIRGSSKNYYNCSSWIKIQRSTNIGQEDPG